MNNKLYIEGELVALPEGEVIAMTYQIADLNDIKDKNSNFSNQFKLPKTQALRQLFENLQKVQALTMKPYKRLVAKYVQNGKEIISDGNVEVQQVSDNYEVIVTSGNISFFDAIAGLKLSDLNLSAYNHYWDRGNIIAANANTAGFIYPIIDWNTEDPSTKLTNTSVNIQCETLLPAMYLHTLIDEIHKQAGFTYSGNVFNDSFYQRLLIPVTDIKGTPFPANTGFNLGRNQPESLPVPGTGFIFPLLGTDINIDDASALVYGTANADPFNSGMASYTYYRYVVSAQLSAYQLSFRLDITSGAGLHDMFINIVRMDSAGNFIENLYNQIYTTLAPVAESYTTLYKYFNAGDQITVVFSTNGFAPQNVIDDATLTLVNVAGDTTIHYNDLFTFNQNLPTMTQTDFIKQFMNLFCIVPSFDRWNKSIKYSKFDEIIANTANAPDWSDKLADDEYTLQFEIGSYGQFNSLGYLPPITSGDGVINIVDETLPLSVKMIEMKFSATEMRQRLIGQDVPLIPAFTDMKFNGSVQPRILVLNKYQYLVRYMQQATPTQQVVNAVLPFCFFSSTASEDLTFTKLIANHYQGFKQVIDRVKVVTAKMKITETDIDTLDHTIPVYLSQFGAYFYINKISNFVDSSRLTSVELIRI